jgi:BspA type Leucine rich repeat region (6 copies)
MNDCSDISNILLSFLTDTQPMDLPFARRRNCGNLETMIIPETVTKIGPLAFAHSGLKSITLLDGRLTEIGEYAFCGCRNLKAVAIPDSVTKIGPYAFAESGLKLIILPYQSNGLTEIGEDAFHDCRNLVVKYRN